VNAGDVLIVVLMAVALKNGQDWPAPRKLIHVV
jgi:hypothetical protein